MGATRETAEQQLKNQNISYRLVGDGDTVTDQVPAGGAVVPASAQIILYLGEEKPDTQVTVPDLTGMTAEQATSTLAQYNLYLKMTGVSSGRHHRYHRGPEPVAGGGEQRRHGHGGDGQVHRQQRRGRLATGERRAR